MKIIIKNKNYQIIEIYSLKEFAFSKKILDKLSSSKEPLYAYIYALNEIINSKQLAIIKFQLKKLNIELLHIYSNIRETVLTGRSFKIDSIFEKEEELKNRLNLSNSKQLLDVVHKGTVRSGDRISSNGDLFILGDVNPGAIISAKKNVYVWGKLLGIAFAGEEGNDNSSISSLYLNPLQLRINGVVAIGPKDKPKDFYPEIAVLHQQSIIIKPFLMEI